MNFRVLFITLMTLALSSCSLLTIKNTTPNVVLGEDAKFTYSGRGAGAGVALMSTMGPVGIAVGVAIDEGIRKDLEASATSAGFNLSELVGNTLASSEGAAQSITIIEYGMKDIRGSDDLMAPYLVYQLSTEEVGRIINGVLYYESGALSNTYSLNDYKENGLFIIESFSELLSEQLICSIANEC
jgi:hypothetical protein